MPFDGTGWPSRPEPPDRPAQPRLGETIGLALIVLGAAMLLLLPVSMVALVDLVRYLRTH